MSYFQHQLKLTFIIAALLAASIFPVAAQQKMDSVTRGQTIDMLKNIKGSLKKEYFDPTFGGIDIDAKFKAAEDKLKASETLSQAFGIIAQAVLDLNDSHTRFWPPQRNVIVDYGWRMKVYGDAAYITAVKPGSDAAIVGLKVGDRVLKINGFAPRRSELWKMIYYYQTLSPQLKMMLDVQSPGEAPRGLQIASQTRTLKRVVDLTRSIDLNEAIREGDTVRNLDRHYFKDVGGTLVWRMPNFAFEPQDVPGMMARANGKETIIFDLRGNPGGYVVTLEALAGYFFDKETKIADVKGRKPFDAQIAKPRGANGFKGKVIVLVDSGSASAAEIFARLMQIERRGIVIGDKSAGAVMQSHGVGFDAGVSTIINYGMNMTVADVIMTDGKSLEHVGVTPDELINPTGSDLAQHSDPVLARAFEIAGIKMDALSAGHIFPDEPFVERHSNIAIDMQF